MIRTIAIVLLFSSISFAQSDPKSVSSASGKCAVAVSGNQNVIKIENDCGITEHQFEQLKESLNRMARDLNRLPGDKVIGELEELQKAVDKINNAPSTEHEYTNSDITAIGGGTGVRLIGNAPVKFDHDRITADGRQANGQPTVGVNDNSSGGTNLSNSTVISRGGAALVLAGPRSHYHGTAGFILRSPSPPECRPRDECIELGKPISQMSLGELKAYGTYLIGKYGWLSERCYPTELNDIYSHTMLWQFSQVQKQIDLEVPTANKYRCLQFSVPPACTGLEASHQMEDLINMLSSK